MSAYTPNGLIGLAVGAMLALAPSIGAAQEVTLTVHHFLSPASPTHKKLIEPWAQRVEEQSGGAIKVELFPSMAMGGKPPELYSQVRDGAADIVWTLGGYTPGVFPRSEVYELPSVHTGSAQATTKAIQASFDLIAEDFDDVHPLLIHVHAGNALVMKDKAVSGVADLEGLKLRTPSRTGAWLIEEYKAEPVGMPVPALPQALSKGVVDGALIPFEIIPPLKLHELSQYSVEGAEGGRFGTSVFMLLMNKERYESLSDELKAVIDANSRMALAEALGATWDEVEQPGRDLQIKSGGEVLKLDADAMAAFAERGDTVTLRWIEEANANGLNGNDLVAAAQAAVAKAKAELE